MDNIHPYLTMPSRAVVGRPGGFSYYDHVCLPENEKDLTWAHAAAATARRSSSAPTAGASEAFLFALDQDVVEAGSCWTTAPCRRKVDTYTRCVEASAAVPTRLHLRVSAQGKRQLSAYRQWRDQDPARPTLWAGAIRAQDCGRQETARLLKASLGAMRQELAGVDEEGCALRNERGRLQERGPRGPGLSERQAAQATLKSRDSSRAQLLAEQD